MKTKSEELQIIKETSAKLGKDSYLGPWLESVAAELEALMRADCFPCVNLTESEHHAQRIISRAENKAEVIERNAKARAEERERAAEMHVSRLVREAKSSLERAIQAI
jgi:hypothetical protein